MIGTGDFYIRLQRLGRVDEHVLAYLKRPSVASLAGGGALGLLTSVLSIQFAASIAKAAITTHTQRSNDVIAFVAF